MLLSGFANSGSQGQGWAMVNHHRQEPTEHIPKPLVMTVTSAAPASSTGTGKMPGTQDIENSPSGEAPFGTGKKQTTNHRRPMSILSCPNSMTSPTCMLAIASPDETTDIRPIPCHKPSTGRRTEKRVVKVNLHATPDQSRYPSPFRARSRIPRSPLFVDKEIEVELPDIQPTPTIQTTYSSASRRRHSFPSAFNSPELMHAIGEPLFPPTSEDVRVQQQHARERTPFELWQMDSIKIPTPAVPSAEVRRAQRLQRIHRRLPFFSPTTTPEGDNGGAIVTPIKPGALGLSSSKILSTASKKAVPLRQWMAANQKRYQASSTISMSTITPTLVSGRHAKVALTPLSMLDLDSIDFFSSGTRAVCPFDTPLPGMEEVTLAAAIGLPESDDEADDYDEPPATPTIQMQRKSICQTGTISFLNETGFFSDPDDQSVGLPDISVIMGTPLLDSISAGMAALECARETASRVDAAAVSAVVPTAAATDSPTQESVGVSSAGSEAVVLPASLQRMEALELERLEKKASKAACGRCIVM
ncbi:hypothetical protein CAOG_06003 [Capsaspora owczarzaki ATCC 30864]|nr:hypothetical protein CAOG_06003 [Capsaspora owczarzaki ATCC 30864]|eukprot:XP_004345593.1 hypothetical protein CAOG_06003 [Capsaspora owczarzaki ATCC 30864]